MDERKIQANIPCYHGYVGNMMNCEAKFITSSDQNLIYQVI